MFGIFRKKTEADRLDKQYSRLMKESYRLSSTDRKASDAKAAEADRLLKKIQLLESN